MAEYLIQSETLDDIANAINAKTGGSSAMTPAEMVTAIGNIPRGSDTDYWADGVAYRNISVIEKEYCRARDGAILTSNTWCRTDYVNCEGAATISFPALPQQESGKVTSNWFFDANRNPVQQIELSKTTSVTITVPQNAAYFVVSNEPAAMQTFLSGDIIPHANA